MDDDKIYFAGWGRPRFLGVCASPAVEAMVE